MSIASRPARRARRRATGELAMAIERAPVRRFFKVLLPGFLDKLTMPKALRKYIGGGAGGEVTLMSALGKPWRVKIHQDGEEVYFGDGWKELAEAHELHVGYFLVFSYKGEMEFSFRVFDLSTLEKDYPPAAVVDETMKRDVTEPKESPKNDQKDDQATKKIKRRRRPKLTPEEMELQLKRSRKRFSANNPDRFEALIYRSNLTWKQLNVPVEFKISNEILETRVVTLVDPEGRSWPVCFRLGKQDGVSNYRPVFGIGWREFAVNNNLKLGDKCIFELTCKEKGVINVQIIRRVIEAST